MRSVLLINLDRLLSSDSRKTTKNYFSNRERFSRNAVLGFCFYSNRLWARGRGRSAIQQPVVPCETTYELETRIYRDGECLEVGQYAMGCWPTASEGQQLARETCHRKKQNPVWSTKSPLIFH